MSSQIKMNEIQIGLLCFEARRWIGVVEEGINGGQIVKLFQRAVDDRALNEPWCMAFAQYCIKMAELAVSELFSQCIGEASTIFRSEHCLTVWNNSPHLQMREATKGSLCIWQNFNGGEATASGHTGIVTDINPDGSILIVEGNSQNDRQQPEGVYLKCYATDQFNHGSLFLKGFLRVWT